MKALTLLLCLPVWAGAQGPTARAPARGPAPAVDTAGNGLDSVWLLARRKYPDALLLSIQGRVAPAGGVLCDARFPMTDGWRYRFYSPQEQAFLVIARCAKALAGPLRELRALEGNVSGQAVEGRFIDSDRLLRVLQEAGVSLPSLRRKSGGKRPFHLTLLRTAEERFKDHPVFWELRAGDSVFVVNAETQKLLDPGTLQGGMAPETAGP